MKMKTYLAIAFLFFNLTTWSQDLITQKNGEDVVAKILEITQTEIKYKKFNNLDGPIFTLLKSDVLMVRYENGTKDIFNQNVINDNPAEVNNYATAVNKNSTNEDMMSKGRRDSQMNYTGRQSGAGWTAATTILLSPLFGLIPAAACASAQPSDNNLNYRDSELMKNNDYNRSYVEQAHKTKKRKIWTTYGISSGAWLLLILLL